MKHRNLPKVPKKCRKSVFCDYFANSQICLEKWIKKHEAGTATPFLFQNSDHPNPTPLSRLQKVRLYFPNHNSVFKKKRKSGNRSKQVPKKFKKSVHFHFFEIKKWTRKSEDTFLTSKSARGNRWALFWMAKSGESIQWRLPVTSKDIFFSTFQNGIICSKKHFLSSFCHFTEFIGCS